MARDGVAYVALGNPLYAPLLTHAGRARLVSDIDVDGVLATLTAVAGLDVPETSGSVST